MRGRVAIVLLLVALPAVATAAARPALVGTARADVLLGRDGSDRVVARGGNDRIAVEYDGGVDDVSCGPGRDIVAADLRDRVRSDCEVVARRIHRDRHVNPESQHESEVEPDSLTVGATTVGLFQVGRNRSGGAASIGFSTTKDGGLTWHEGILPGLTTQSRPTGSSARASDPVLAYDALHGVWLANTLALSPGVTRLTVHRSPDGLTWTGPIEAAIAETEQLAYDKNWITCDNGVASPFRGRCYLAYTLIGNRIDDLAVQYSDDGGRTWSAAVTLRTGVTGVIPVVQPDGRLVLAFWNGRSEILAVASLDGGVTLGSPVPVSDLQSRSARPLRAPPLIAADIDGNGDVIVTWQDCRFRAGCPANDVVVSRSRDGGRTWTAPARVTTGRNAVMPTIGVEPGSGRLAIAYYSIHRNGIDAEVVTSPDGTRWSAPQRLNARRMPVEWMPQTTLGRMLADYIGVSWVRGRPLVVLALASPPRNGKLHQAIYAARG
ncbi:MAG: sialidase family protein [Gaiellaceae bacterium]